MFFPKYKGPSFTLHHLSGKHKPKDVMVFGGWGGGMEVAPNMNTCNFDGETPVSCSCTAVVTKSPRSPLDKVSAWALQLHLDIMANTNYTIPWELTLIVWPAGSQEFY